MNHSLSLSILSCWLDTSPLLSLEELSLYDEEELAFAFLGAGLALATAFSLDEEDEEEDEIPEEDDEEDDYRFLFAPFFV